ncbi:hypothetical protein GOP47_0018454 [Adiantum capillus-veneris]|uniref:Uncharacterized protein n=1 Tax=Adiantum capillus-veneris TaxID=13818 RepID=A0A9D4Z9K9_ADICA|nr:hypothetical protein GOP47_0018454 [Adiantum capillus-veneris]
MMQSIHMPTHDLFHIYTFGWRDVGLSYMMKICATETSSTSAMEILRLPTALQDICEYNDITEGQLIRAPETITSMEMFMQGVPQIYCLSFFQHLVSLSLVQQSILSMDGLHNCPSLRILRLNENFIERLDGLENCLRLEELYLHSNKIQHVKNLAHLTALEVLWLANNAIQEIEGLGHCVRLKELNMAQNPIKQLGEVSNLKSLEKLNVAATNVGSFKEVAKLSKLRVLRDLRFFDCQWGKSPVCLLHNYQTYVLFRLSSLQLLDAEHVSEEEKQAANTIYTRKRVYYNMCIKTLKHRKSEIVLWKTATHWISIAHKLLEIDDRLAGHSALTVQVQWAAEAKVQWRIVVSCRLKTLTADEVTKQGTPVWKLTRENFNDLHLLRFLLGNAYAPCWKQGFAAGYGYVGRSLNFPKRV